MFHFLRTMYNMHQTEPEADHVSIVFTTSIILCSKFINTACNSFNILIQCITSPNNTVPCWQYLLGYRPRHTIFHILYSRLHRRYYNRSVTNGSLTSCVDYRLLAVHLWFNCWLLSSPAGSLTRLQNSKLKNSQLKNWTLLVSGSNLR
jgi:hypothetical protein